MNTLTPPSQESNALTTIKNISEKIDHLCRILKPILTPLPTKERVEDAGTELSNALLSIDNKLADLLDIIKL